MGQDYRPERVCTLLVSYAQLLKRASEDFFVLPAGLDVSASSDGRSLDAAVFIQRMLNAEPALFDHLDGWTSHSYPNPAFSGSVFAVGRGTLRSFLWEREYLKQLGVTKKLPVFITETGWVHREGVQTNSGLLSSDQVGANFLLAAAQVWTDPDIVAITPFVLNYQGLPFDHFSWKKLGSQGVLPAVRRISTNRGNYPVSPISGRNIRWNTGLCRVLWLPAPPMYFPHCSKMKGRVFCQNREGTIPSNWSQPLRFLRYGSRFRSWSPASTGL